MTRRIIVITFIVITVRIVTVVVIIVAVAIHEPSRGRVEGEVALNNRFNFWVWGLGFRVSGFGV